MRKVLVEVDKNLSGDSDDNFGTARSSEVVPRELPLGRRRERAHGLIRSLL